jgi:hypothetical protein
MRWYAAKMMMRDEGEDSNPFWTPKCDKEDERALVDLFDAIDRRVITEK